MGVTLVEDGVVCTRIPCAHSPLHHNGLLGFPHLRTAGISSELPSLDPNQCNSLQFYVIQFNSIQCKATQFSAMRLNSGLSTANPAPMASRKQAIDSGQITPPPKGVLKEELWKRQRVEVGEKMKNSKHAKGSPTILALSLGD